MRVDNSDNTRFKVKTQFAKSERGQSAQSNSALSSVGDQIDFSTESQVLTDLLHQAPSLANEILPWYFRNANEQNKQRAVALAKSILNKAHTMGFSFPLPLIIDEVMFNNGLKDELHQNPRFIALAQNHLQYQDLHQLLPAQMLSDDEKSILEHLFYSAKELGEPVLQVSDSAMAYVIEKWAAINQSKPVVSLNQFLNEISQVSNARPLISAILVSQLNLTELETEV
ncbi:MAG: hypothetical protein OEY38_11625 [Gammaproteobacteria bacterium]|nr:hypothetical protein [Gammaproteobacteria bacterium]